MDAFYASVEQRNNPTLRGKPVVVGGSPEERGVVAAASYEARKFGIRSAMPMSRALRMSPDIIRVPPHFSEYEKASELIHGVFREYTDIVEPVSLDEAYLDLSRLDIDFSGAQAMAWEIKKRIKQSTLLTASVGLGPNKYIAKVASDFKKPDGFCAIEPERIMDFLNPLPVRCIPGVGEKTEQRLRILKIDTIGQLREQSLLTLQQAFGVCHGQHLFEMARGIDASPVQMDWKRKSLSQEQTFPYDIDGKDKMRTILQNLANDVSNLLNQEGLQGRNIGIKVRFSDFQITGRTVTIDHRTADAIEIGTTAIGLLDKIDLNNRKIRLLGVRVACFEPISMPQRRKTKSVDLQMCFW